MAGVWNLRPTPRRTNWYSCRRLRSVVPSKMMRPLLGLDLPVITSISVVLPAPLGPIRNRISP